MSVFRGENLNKSFARRPVVKNVDLQVRSGEIIGLLGRNGAGKTTTFLMMVGLVKPDQGNIFLDGHDISARTTPERARLGITYLPQENSVFLKATVEGNLRLVLELQPSSRDERERTTREAFQELGLSALIRQSAHSLSGGERRKLEICRSLVLKPKFLLLDEPFTGVDPLTIIDLQRILLNLRDRGLGIIVSDHNVRDTLRITDRAYILDEGEVLIEGSPQQIAAEEKARQRFLGKDFKLAEELSHPQRNNDHPESRPEKRGIGRNREPEGQDKKPG